MSNIYLKVIIEKKKTDVLKTSIFQVLKNSSPGQFLGSQPMQISLIFKTCRDLKIRVLEAKVYVAFLLF